MAKGINKTAPAAAAAGAWFVIQKNSGRAGCPMEGMI